MSDVVPFGKYKGKPVEALAQDRQYVEWLTAQPWFKDRYQTIYNVIVNNFQEPSETPEHNALQVLFLDAAFRERFLAFVCGKLVLKTKATFESNGFDAVLEGREPYEYKNDKGEIVHTTCSVVCHVEIKPYVSDDYPAVLRQIKTARDVYGKSGSLYEPRRAALFLEKYTGVGATEEQFIAIFESDGIKIVFRDEV